MEPNLTGRDLLTKMAVAWKRNDMGEVAYLKDLSRTMLEEHGWLQKSITDEQWEKVKDFVDRLTLPNDSETSHISPVKSGYHEGHQMYKYTLRRNIGPCKSEFIWGVCSSCKDMRYRFWVVYRPKQNVCYKRDFDISGKQQKLPVDNASFMENLLHQDGGSV